MPSSPKPQVRLGHCITIGQTESGKSLLNKQLARTRYKAHGVKVIVLDVMQDPDWEADEMFDDADEFLAYVKDPDMCLQAALFIDEAGQSINKYLEAFNWLTTQSRHFGHQTHLITQRAEMVSPTIRNQCLTVFAFNVNYRDAKKYSEDFNCKELLAAENLPQGHYIQKTRHKPIQRGRMW